MDTYRKDKSLKLAPFQIKVKEENQKNTKLSFSTDFTFNLFVLDIQIYSIFFLS